MVKVMAAIFLASEASAFMTGQILFADAGLECLARTTEPAR